MRFFQRKECIVATIDGHRKIGTFFQKVQDDLVGESASYFGTAKVPHFLQATEGGLRVP
jgi:hypothetical protein